MAGKVRKKHKMEKINKYPTDTTVVPDSMERKRQTSSAESDGMGRRWQSTKEEREAGAAALYSLSP